MAEPPESMSNPDRIDLGRRRTVADILMATGGLYRRYALLFAILALAVIAPFDLAVLGITGYGPLAHKSAAVRWLVFLITPALITPLVSALHIHAVVAIGDGRKPRLLTVARSGVKVLPVVAAADLSTAIPITLGYLALFIPGVLLTLRWAVVSQAAALEHKSWRAAISGSAELTDGHYWHVLRLLLVIYGLGLGATLGARTLPLGYSSSPASVAVGIAVGTVIASFSALTLALLYFDLRARAEATQAQDLTEKREASSASPPPASWGGAQLGQTVLGGVLTVVIGLVFVSGVIKRIDGHVKPSVGALVIEVAIVLCSAWLALRPWRARGSLQMPSRTFLAIVGLAGTLAAVFALASVAGLIKRVEGHPKPHTGALIGEALTALILGLCATFAWRGARLRSRV